MSIRGEVLVAIINDKVVRMMKESIRQEIEDFVLNYHDQHSTVTVCGSPIVGFASASDPMFKILKSAVSETHAMPAELMHNARTVGAFFLPFTEEIARTNIGGGTPSLEWDKAWTEAWKLMHDLYLHLDSFLRVQKIESRITLEDDVDEDKLISDWSDRHVAFITGLGRFGLNNMLITEKGCCGLIGSFIMNAEVEPDPQRDQEACSHRYNGKCLKCIERCVHNVLFLNKFDRHKCAKHHCGKCLVGLPCSHIDPVQRVNA
ncbi:epoxyqueuosine reductase [Dehalococcoidia bacterium]|nr:epoxyqueuosine reductase [Dehalococcoidia bacterium]